MMIHISKIDGIETYQDPKRMTQEQFILALLALEPILRACNDLFVWDRGTGTQDITNAFCGDICFAFNDGYPIVYDRSGSMYLAEYMKIKGNICIIHDWTLS